MVLLYAPGFSDGDTGTAPKWTSSQHTWIGWDGSEWDLSHGLSGLALQAGTRGLLEPPFTRYATKPGAVSGSIHRGSTYDERDCFWPLLIKNGDGTQPWLDLNRRFWQTMDKDRPGRWVVTQSDGARRTLTVRFNGLSEDALDDDLGLVARQKFGINLVAENPFWMGTTKQWTFTNEAAQGFYQSSGDPYYLSPSGTVASAEVSNVGDVDVWPVWTVFGPFSAVTVAGVGFPALADGEWIRIDTDPTDQVAWDNDDVDRTGELTNFDQFAEIPRGTTVPLSVSMTGTGSVAVQLTPAYRWAA